jgi:putative Mg2+ transporter-C (MgtC) family protein
MGLDRRARAFFKTTHNMADTLIQMAMADDVNIVNAILRMLLSLLLGAIVGIERMIKGQTAGMRTFALIAMGSTLAMLLSIYLPQEFNGLKNGDPGRIAAQVVSGVGFLGAGAIIQMKGSVRGLTTAAGIWITAMLGLAVGAGMYLIPCIATILVMFVLVIMNRFEYITHLGGESKIVRMKTRGIITDIDVLKSVLQKEKIIVVDVFVKYNSELDTTVINFLVRCPNNTTFSTIFEKMRQKHDTLSITLSNEVNI